MSIGFLLRGPEEAVIWRGPMKMAVIKQFLTDVEWGDLDYLVVDAPPGTGDEPLSVCQLIEHSDGAVVVTTPQEVALAAVRRSITFCRKLGVPVLGVVENMSGFVCARCGELADVFGTGGGERLAKEMAVPFLGRIPLDPILSTSGDAGSPCIQEHPATPTGEAFAEVIRSIKGHEAVPGQSLDHHEEETMRIAIPIAAGKLSQHFGHCERFDLIEVDQATGKILGTQQLESPEHQPGLLPRWLAEKGATLVIAGGMGGSAQKLFSESGIQVLTGAPSDTSQALVEALLAGTLRMGSNQCDH